MKFVSLKPHKLVVTGRLEHFISAFGEHVIGSEVEYAMEQACKKWNLRINEFSVAPQTNPSEGLPYHEWFVEFAEPPENLNEFAQEIDRNLQTKNSYYSDLIQGKILQTLKITKIETSGFQNYMKSVGKLGGQNKLPRLSNDRKIADALKAFYWSQNN